LLASERQRGAKAIGTGYIEGGRGKKS